MKLIKLSMIVLVATTLFGCASNKDILVLQSQVDTLKESVDQASKEAKIASTFASEAVVKSTDAESAAKRAEQYAKDTNAKLDSLFKKAMMK